MADAGPRYMVVIGGSAGGIHAARDLLQRLPADFPAGILIVLHIAPGSPSVLPQILVRAGPLKAEFARDGAPIRPGHVLVAPPDHHLLVDDGRVRLSHGPRENRHRPSIDVLFRSAAVSHGAGVIGVVLSGMLDDGAAGLWAVKRRGGIALVQDPAEAEYPDMPRNAAQAVRVDGALPVPGLAARLGELVRQPMQPAGPASQSMDDEVRMASQEPFDPRVMDRIASRAALTCPECGGSMWQMEDAGTLRYRCHVGHAYSLLTLAAGQGERVEAALWAAMRALEEDGRIADRLASGANERGDPDRAEYHEDRALAVQRHAEVLRGLLERAPYAEPPADAADTEPK